MNECDLIWFWFDNTYTWTVLIYVARWCEWVCVRACVWVSPISLHVRAQFVCDLQNELYTYVHTDTYSDYTFLFDSFAFNFTHTQERVQVSCCTHTHIKRCAVFSKQSKTCMKRLPYSIFHFYCYCLDLAYSTQWENLFNTWQTRREMALTYPPFRYFKTFQSISTRFKINFSNYRFFVQLIPEDEIRRIKRLEPKI